MILHDKYGLPFSDKYPIYKAYQDKALRKKNQMLPGFLGSISLFISIYEVMISDFSEYIFFQFVQFTAKNGES